MSSSIRSFINMKLAEIAEWVKAYRWELGINRRLERLLALTLVMGVLATLLVCYARANQLLVCAIKGEAEAEPAFVALFVENLRIHVIARNIANAETTLDVDGKPYRRQFVVCEDLPRRSFDGSVMRTVRVARVETDRTAARAVYAPGNPGADANGFVTHPGIDMDREIADLNISYREYMTNLAVVNKVLQAGSSPE
jgi:flagellar basal-body rod protein FlgC